MCAIVKSCTGFMVVWHYANCEYCAKSTEFEIIKKKIHATFLEIISKSYDLSIICKILRFNSAQGSGTMRKEKEI